jgi:hypothetical protein
VPGKTRGSIFSLAEMHALLKEAHEYCKKTILPTKHKVGKSSPRTKFTRSREDYLNCIREYINKKYDERAREILSHIRPA